MRARRVAGWLGMLLTVGLLARAWQRYDAQRDMLVARRLQRQVTVANEVLSRHLDELQREARHALRQHPVTAPGAAAALLADLRLAGAEWVTISSPPGQRLAGAGRELLPSPAAQQLLATAVAAGSARGLVPRGLGFDLLVAEQLPRGPGRPAGVLLTGRTLNRHLVARIEEITGGTVALVPDAFVLSHPELDRVMQAGTAHLPAVAARADELLNGRLIASDPSQDVVFQQFRTASGEPAGILALSLPRDPLLVWGERGMLLAGLGLLLALALLGGHELRAQQQRVHWPPTVAARQRGARRSATTPDLTVEQALRPVAEHLNHHLNNALAVVIGNLEFLREQVQQQPDRQHLDDVIERSWQASNLIRRFQKACFRDGLVRREAVDLAQVATRAMARLGLAAGSPAVSCEGLAGVCVSGLEGDLTEVLVALLENALAAAPHTPVQVRAEHRGPRVVLTVRDHGPGLDPETTHHAGQLFYTTRGPQAVGLGLALVDGVVTRHGGWWQIESPPEGGCLVRLDLPAWTAPVAALPPSQRYGVPPQPAPWLNQRPGA
ncbi:MAG: HAMP domain-containing histidine kinase [Fimbriimonadaceae bacterium]|nr:HAMP domain-containing histidine kinase [Fimbriimonadaceae bacterium]